MSMKFGEILVELEKTTEACVSDALKRQEETEKDKKIGSILVDNGDITPMDVIEALCEQTGLSAINEKYIEKQDYSVLKDFPINLARKYRALPLYEEDYELYVATSEPQKTFLYNQMFMIYEKTVVPVLMEETKLTDLINISYSRMDTGEGHLNADELKDMVDEDDTGIPDLIDSEDEAPIIRFVNNIISRAVKQGVSDIHFESFEDEMYVRFRKDGKLHLIQQVPKAAQSGLITRIKIMSKMNISEKRLPQDGNIKVRIAGNDIDFRVSTIPSMHGESVVLRVLDKATQKLSLEEVGFSQRDLKQMRRLIQHKHGIFLVTGPTGSGKTTTLYSALVEINKPDIKIITEEDPVEYQLKGINQINIRPKIGLTFASGLRSILRQDPDVILVGEIRDKETANISVNASLTGHLVFSTLHTNDAPTAFTRLIDMGVEPFLISSTILGVLAQRLVRVLCPTCREAYFPEAPVLEELGLDPSEYSGHPFYKAVGCEECSYSGYSGRSGIFELLVMNEEMKRAVVKKEDASAIRKLAASSGMLTLREDGAMKAVKGITSPDEVLLRTQEDK